jgi:hypothetical protein
MKSNAPRGNGQLVETNGSTSGATRTSSGLPSSPATVYNLSKYSHRFHHTTPESPVRHGTIPSTVGGEEHIIAHNAPVSAPALSPLLRRQLRLCFYVSPVFNTRISLKTVIAPIQTRNSSRLQQSQRPPRDTFQDFHTTHVVKRYRDRGQYA